jgi:hypothetical protein
VKSLALLGMAGLLLAVFFQCCPSAATEAPSIQGPSEEQPVQSQPAATLQPTVAPVGLSRDNPVPLNHTLTAGNGATITVHGIVSRSADAAAKVQQWSVFNAEPAAGKEYVIVSVSVGYEGGDRETLTTSEYDFRAVVNGVIVEPPFALVSEDPLSGEMFAGGRIDGVVTFEVPQGATGIALIYTVLMEDSYYFATE